MSSIIQNLKSGFANMKELFGILLNSDVEDSDSYDLYINGNDASLAKTAMALKQIEEEQEAKRLSIYEATKKVVRRNPKK